MSPPDAALPPVRLSAPTLSAVEKARLRAFWDLLEAHRQELDEVTRAAALELPVFARIMSQMTPEQEAAQQEQSIRHQRAALVDGEWTAYLGELRTQGGAYARMGVDFGDWHRLVRVYQAAIIDLVQRERADDPDRATDALQGANLFLSIAMGGLGEAYLAAKEAVIVRQQEAIAELSTPVLQVRERLLVLPIVGAIDTHRARHITESLLHAIRDRRAQAVVIDITGVPIVDSKVASHIVQTVEAGRLMGARVIVSGVSPEIAMTMVSMGADLPGVPTVGDLQAGLVRAQRLLARLDAAPTDDDVRGL